MPTRAHKTPACAVVSAAAVVVPMATRESDSEGGWSWNDFSPSLLPALPVAEGVQGAILFKRTFPLGEIVLKRYDLDTPENEVYARSEATTLWKLRHPGVVTSFGYFVHEHQPLHEGIPPRRCLYIVLERAIGTLAGFLDDRSRANASIESCYWESLALAAQVIAVVAFLHREGIAHRDIKLANFLLFLRDLVKMTDLGACAPSAPRLAGGGAASGGRAYDDGMTAVGESGLLMLCCSCPPTRAVRLPIAGSDAYMAPEVFAAFDRGARVGNPTGDAAQRSDVYSVGAMIWELVTDIRVSRPAVEEAVCPLDEEVPPWMRSPQYEPFIALVRSMMRYDPAKRVSMEVVRAESVCGGVTAPTH